MLVRCDIWLREIYCARATRATYTGNKGASRPVVNLLSGVKSLEEQLRPVFKPKSLVPRSSIRTNWLVSWYHVVSSGINWPNLIVHRLYHGGAIQSKADVFSCFLCHTWSAIASAFLITWEKYVSKHQNRSFLRHPFFPVWTHRYSWIPKCVFMPSIWF